MRGAAYLSKSPDGVYYARFVVPLQQLPPGVSREFRLSTRTKDPKAARALARHLRTCFEHFLLQNVMYTRERAIAHLQVHMPKKPDNLPMPFGLHITAPNGTQVRLTDLTASDVAQSGGMGALIASAYNSTQGGSGTESTVAIWQKPEIAEPPPPAPKKHPNRSRLRVDRLYAEYMEYEQAREANGEINNKAMGQIKTRLRPFLEHFQGKAMNDLTTFDMEQYARELAYYPIYIDKIPMAQELKFADIVEKSKSGTLLTKAGVPALTITESTHDGYIDDAINFVDYCRRRDLASASLTEGLRIEVPNLRAGVKRRAFLKDEMQKIFNSDYYRKRRYNVPHQYWVPLLAAFTGARLNEIAQLCPSDIRQDDEGLWYFDITTTDDDGKSLKNEASKRIVPVHQKLIDLHFIEYVKTKKAENAKNIFDIEPERADRYGRGPARWFNDEYLRGYLKITDRTVVFHSFRHRFITSMHQAIFDATDIKGELIASTTPALILRRMVGHSDLSIMTAGRGNDAHTDTYTGALSIRSMKKVIDLLEYPEVIFHEYATPAEGVILRKHDNELEISSEDFSNLFG